MFFVAIMGSFIAIISGVHLVWDGYVWHGIPSFLVSGIIPAVTAFLKGRKSCDIDCPDCGCGECPDLDCG